MTDAVPVSIGFASRVVVAECVRKWAAGKNLSERERQIVDDALTYNKQEAILAVFSNSEEANVG